MLICLYDDLLEKHSENFEGKLQMICIVTVYNSFNIGSYLQAKALHDFLSDFDEVVFLNTHSRSPAKKTMRAVIKGIIKLKPTSVKLEIKKYRYFKQNLREFRIIELDKCSNDTIFVFGSDEIWNISRSQMSNYPVFWGYGLKGKKVAYAPSINQTSESELLTWPYLNQLKEFTFIGVRDEYTKIALHNVCGLKIEQVVDPTMLFEPEHYKMTYTPIGKNYIAVYMFEGRVSKQHIMLLKGIAKRLNLLLVGVGANYDWCDESYISRNSFDYLKNAEYTIVNTFHGTIFSILHNKKFLCFADSCKVENLLMEFELVQRKAQTFDTEVEIERITKAIDYERINEMISSKRDKSIDFLKAALGF